MKKYNKFKSGDEVYTEKPNWKAITANKPYIVLKYYKPPGFVDDYKVRMIEVMSDKGFISRYATDKFKKTESQIRHDKLIEVLSDLT